MKSTAMLAVSTLLILAIPAIAPAAETTDPHAHHMATDNKAPFTAVHKASGTVKKIDVAGSAVTIAHGPVAALKWPAMTMKFKVTDKSLFDKLTINKKIDFEFVETGRAYIVTAVK